MRAVYVGGLFVFVAMGHVSAATFTVTNTASVGPGSLHQAILEANVVPGHDDVVFNIPGDAVQKIDISQFGLPEVTDPITIDGYTQPGAKPNSLAAGNDAVILIQIDAGAANSKIVDGLVISAGGSTVRGLAITGVLGRVYYGIPEDPTPLPPSEGDTLVLRGHGGNVIEGNFINVDPGVPSDSWTYSYRGIHVLSDGNRIGGGSPAARNVISGHDVGIEIIGAGTVVQGNYIGTDPSGISKSRGEVGGNGLGVTVLAPNTRIGGAQAGAGNLIAGSSQAELLLLSSGAIVQGNRIGPALNGTRPLERLSRGVQIRGSDNLIGGLDAGAGNVLLELAVESTRSDSFPVSNQILSNLYFADPQSAISLVLIGRRAHNDIGDRDDGPNHLQNTPIISAVQAAGGFTSITGGLSSVPSTDYTLQFYRSTQFQSRSELLATRSVSTNEAGQVNFHFDLPNETVPRDFITATATDAQGNTSEFFRSNAQVRVANISTRGKIGSDAHILIGGFVLHRPPFDNSRFQERVLIRALGPSLPLGDETLADPMLELYDANGGLIAQNDDWRSSQEQEIAATGAAPQRDSEAAILATLPDAGYTAQVRGSKGSTGTGVVEVYDLGRVNEYVPQQPGWIVNISTRGEVAQADDALISGFIIDGDAAQPVIIRAIGPDLIGRGIPDALRDPVLELRNASGTLLASNDDWRDTQERDIGATVFAPGDDRDAAIMTTLLPGSYTAVVRGKNGGTGVGLVELYDLIH